MTTRFYHELLNFCTGLLKNRELATDIVQESYARVLAVEKSGSPVHDPRALLHKTARRLMIDQHRRDALRDHDDIDSLSEFERPVIPTHEQPEELAALAEATELYYATIESLPPRCREAFILFAFEDLTQAQIAKRMGTSVSMVEKHIFRGRMACRACERKIEGT